jgi:hypothetical protein
VVTSTGSYTPRRWMSSLRASNSSGGRSGRTWYMGGGAVVPIGGMAVVPGDAGIAVSNQPSEHVMFYMSLGLPISWKLQRA